MSTSKHFVPRRSAAFTLVELLVSMSILTLILLVLVQITESTRRTWTYSTGKIQEFREARDAFESMTRRLAQATLNTYWDYDSPTAPTKYLRQSELRFISGPAEKIIGSTNPPRPSHAVFFQAPLGYVEDAKYTQLPNLLNTWGYYIEWNSDATSRPPFLNSLNPPLQDRWRFRLMEMMEPSELLTVYNMGTDAKAWFTKPLTSTPVRTRVLAENILMIALLPHLGEKDKKSDKTTVVGTTELAPNYFYNSVNQSTGNAGIAQAAPDPVLNTKNQLPPLIRVSMVALDEATFGRFQGTSQTMPAWWKSTWWTDANNGNPDKDAILKALNDNHIKYREFTAEIPIRGAKWSTN